MTRFLGILSLRLVVGTLAAFVFCTGCAFVEAATEQTLGEGQIPRFDQEILYPDIDELTGLTAEQVDAIPGFPGTLNNGTFAHLQGAFAITGECRKTLEVPAPEDNEALISIAVTVTNCTPDLRCAEFCEEGFFGMMFEAKVDLLLLTEERANKLQNLLSELTPDAIAQIRLRFFELELFQEDDSGETFVIHDWIEGFELGMENDKGDAIVVLTDEHLPMIDPDDPQRFDIPAAEDYTQDLKERILAAQAVSTTVVQRMRVPQPNLYELVFVGAGLRFDLQPEFVVSVVEVLENQI